jgi:uroporphyrinogen-III synthase
MSFAGKHVLSLESRRAVEMAELIRRNGGDPFVAPSMKEVPIENNLEAFQFAGRLFDGDFDMVIFLTGVGTRYLDKVIATRYPEAQFRDALRRITIVARGPKPVAVLRDMNVPVTIAVPEPNTWREILEALRNRPENRIAIQEYGRSNPELVNGLRGTGAEVTLVPVYQWELPENIEPLREAVDRLSRQTFEVTLFTTSQQVVHLLQVARELRMEEPARAGIRKSVIASIGPTCTQTLVEHGFYPDMEPSHVKLGFLVKEAAERSEELLWKKRI